MAAMAAILHAPNSWRYSVILQLWPMSRVRSMRPMPSHIAHDSARSVSSSSSNCSLQRVPEVLVVAQAGVIGGEALGELRGDALLLAVARPGPPLRGVVVEVFVDARRDAVGVAGVLAHHAFVVERDHHAGQLPDPHRQPVLVVDRVGESGHRDRRCRAICGSRRRRRRRRSLQFGSWRDRTPEAAILEHVLVLCQRAVAELPAVVSPVPLHQHPVRDAFEGRLHLRRGPAGPRTSVTGRACRRCARRSPRTARRPACARPGSATAGRRFRVRGRRR